MWPHRGAMRDVVMTAEIDGVSIVRASTSQGERYARNETTNIVLLRQPEGIEIH